MIRIAICDDSPDTLDYLKHIVVSVFDTYGKSFVTMCYNAGDDLLREHKMDPYDIIFLDIDMPAPNGFEIAKSLREEFAHCFIIFVTNHSELVYESMNFQPFHFIRKDASISIEDSIIDVAKKLMKHMNQNDRVVLEDDISGRCAVYVRDIIYIETDKHYVKYYIFKREHPIKMRASMKDCEDKFLDYSFAKIHKKYLINLRYLARINSKYDEVTMKYIDQKLPMSKNLKESVDEKYTIYLRTIT